MSTNSQRRRCQPLPPWETVDGIDGSRPNEIADGKATHLANVAVDVECLRDGTRSRARSPYGPAQAASPIDSGLFQLRAIAGQYSPAQSHRRTVAPQSPIGAGDRVACAIPLA